MFRDVHDAKMNRILLNYVNLTVSLISGQEHIYDKPLQEIVLELRKTLKH